MALEFNPFYSYQLLFITRLRIHFKHIDIKEKMDFRIEYMQTFGFGHKTLVLDIRLLVSNLLNLDTGLAINSVVKVI